MRPANGISETAFRRRGRMSWVEGMDIFVWTACDSFHDLEG